MFVLCLIEVCCVSILCTNVCPRCGPCCVVVEEVITHLRDLRITYVSRLNDIFNVWRSKCEVVYLGLSTLVCRRLPVSVNPSVWSFT